MIGTGHNFVEYDPNVEVQIIRKARHCPAQETPVYLVLIIEAFLRRHT